MKPIKWILFLWFIIFLNSTSTLQSSALIKEDFSLSIIGYWDAGAYLNYNPYPENYNSPGNITYAPGIMYNAIVIQVRYEGTDEVILETITIWQEFSFSDMTWNWTGPIKISGSADYLFNGDSYEFSITNHTFSSSYAPIYGRLTVIHTNNFHSFILPINFAPEFTLLETWPPLSESTIGFSLFILVLSLIIVARRKYYYLRIP